MCNEIKKSEVGACLVPRQANKTVRRMTSADAKQICQVGASLDLRRVIKAKNNYASLVVYKFELLWFLFIFPMIKIFFSVVARYVYVPTCPRSRILVSSSCRVCESTSVSALLLGVSAPKRLYIANRANSSRSRSKGKSVFFGSVNYGLDTFFVRHRLVGGMDVTDQSDTSNKDGPTSSVDATNRSEDVGMPKVATNPIENDGKTTSQQEARTTTSGTFPDWMSILTSLDSRVDGRYEVDEDDKVAPTHGLGLLPDFMSFPGLAGLFRDMPPTIRAVDLEDGNFGWNWSMNYRFGAGDIPKWHKDMFLTERRKYVLYSPEKDRDIKICCSLPGDRYHIPISAKFDQDSGTPMDTVANSRKYVSIWGGREYNAYYDLLRGYAGTYQGGDNHIAYLCSMLRYYLAAMVRESSGGVVTGSFMPRLNSVVMIRELRELANISLSGSFQSVCCAVDDPEYLHFLATCAESGTTKYKCRPDEHSKSVTVYDRMSIDFQCEMVIITRGVFGVNHGTGRWHTNSREILQYIRRYSNTLCLTQQLNDAIKIMKIWGGMGDAIGEVGCGLPSVNHVCDYLQPVLEDTRALKNRLDNYDNSQKVRTIIGELLPSSLIHAGIASFCEGALAERNMDVPDEPRIMAVLDHFDALSNHGRRKIIDFADKVSGLDLCFLRQVNGDKLIIKLVVDYMMSHYDHVFERMLIPAPVANSWAHWLRRATVYNGSAMDNGLYQDTMEVLSVLNGLRFNEVDNDISTSLSIKPRKNTDKSFFYQSEPSKYQWLTSLKGVESRLFFWYGQLHIEKEDSLPRTTPYSSGAVANFLSRMIGRQSLSDGRDCRDKEQKKFEQKQIRLTSNEEEKKEREDAEAARLAKDKISEAKMRLKQAEARQLELELENARLKNQEPSKIREQQLYEAASIIYEENGEGNTIVADDMKKTDWIELKPVGTEQEVGDCGPIACATGLLNLAGRNDSKKLEKWNPTLIRKAVEHRAGVYHKAGEWWADEHWIIASELFDVDIYVRYEVLVTTKVLKKTEIRHGYKRLSDGNRSAIMYIGHTGGNHWVALAPKLKLTGSGRGVKVVTEEEFRFLRGEEKEKHTSENGSESVPRDAVVRPIRSTAAERDTREKNTPKSSQFKHLEKVWLQRLGLAVSSYNETGLLSHPLYVEDFSKLVISRWDDVIRSDSEYDALKEPYSGPNGSVSPVVPRWVIELKQLDNTISTLEKVKMYYDNRMVPKIVMQLWYLILYPFRPLPAEYDFLVSLTFRKLGCGCFGCNVQKRNWQCGGYVSSGTSCSNEGKLCNGRDRSVFLASMPAKLGRGFSKEDAAKLNKLFPFTHPVGGRKTNMDLGSLCRALYLSGLKCEKLWKLVRDFCLHRIGQSNNTVSAMVLFLAGNSLTPQGCIILNNVCFLGTCAKHHIEHFSGVHDEIRSTTGYRGMAIDLEEDHSQLMYLHLLYGRLGKEVDWKEEEVKRTRERKPLVAWDGQKWSTEEAERMVAAEIDIILQKCKPTKHELESLEELFERRHEWIAGGAATRRKKVLDSELAKAMTGEEVEQSKLKVNKRSYSETMLIQELYDALEGEPIQYAYAHTKMNELAKTRSIFGVELTHYMLHHFMCKPIESGMRMEDLTLKEEVAQGWQEVLNRRSWCKQGWNVNSYDFSDFNDQHELSIMRMLHLKIGEWYKTHYKQDKNLGQYLKVSKWIAESFMNSVYYDKEQDKLVKVTGGMYSGNRATTLINTLLNRAYLKMVEKSSARMGVKIPVIDAYRMGDDVVMKTRSDTENVEFNRMADMHGLESNPMKLLSEKGRCEFLRLTYYRSGKVLGSLARCVGAFVNGNWESEAQVDPIARTQAAWDQCSVMMRRGMDCNLTQALFENLVTYYSPVIHKGLQTAPIPQEYVTTCVEDGGMGLSRFDKVEIRSKKVPFTRVKHRSEYHSKEIPHNKMRASKDLIKTYNRDRLPSWAKIEKSSEGRALDHLISTTLGTELPPSKIGLGLSVSEANKIVLQAKTKDYYPYRRGKKSKMDRLGSMADMFSSIRDIDAEKRKYEAIEKLKPMLHLVTVREGRTRDDVIRAVTKIEPSAVMDFDQKVNRLDRGSVPPHLMSQMSLYCMAYGVDMSYMIDQYTNTVESTHIKY